MLSAQSELRYLKGVGPRRAASLLVQGIGTIEDLGTEVLSVCFRSVETVVDLRDRRCDHLSLGA